MFRPERMSRVSVTGSKGVMEDVVETVYDLRLLHVSDYDESWDGFRAGDPVEGADDYADKLVTVRSLESILDVDADELGTSNRIVGDEAIDEEIEEIRTEVNELDDRRDDLRSELREVEERIDMMEPFVTLGIDLELLRGYETLAVSVGEGDAAGVRAALVESAVEQYEVFDENGIVAVFARTDESTLQELLVDASFTALEIPDGEGAPGEFLDDLRRRKGQLESRLETVENELGDLEYEVGGFLLAAEERLSIELEKREAPLSFATTENAFVAEGWIPTGRYDEFERALHAAVGDHVEVTELERAAYDDHGHPEAPEKVEEGGQGKEEPIAPAAADGGEDEVAADGGERTAGSRSSSGLRSDGGTVTMNDQGPPVVQDNPGPAKPFEALVDVINKPKYSEFDPTVLVFLTFPAFFGFMIGDLGYGILYFLGGLWLARSFDSDVIRSLGGVGMWAGAFTMIFGVLYGEFFGLHQLGEIVWGGNPPMHKGLQPHYGDYALLWLTLSLFAGVIHLTIGWVLDFIENLEHGLWDALTESGSWLIMMFSLWAWIFADTPPGNKAPDFLVGEESLFASGGVADVGFTGLPALYVFDMPSFVPGLGGLPVSAWLLAFLVGLVLLAMADFIEVVEFLNVMVNVLSYTRLAAVLLAKAGMAFVVNLLVFGVYVTGEGHDASWHFGLGGMPAEAGVEFHHETVQAIMFPGLVHAGIVGILAGAVILVLGHLLVLALGITSAGLQAVRLEYVEFFGKFYEGGGSPYTPFGRERVYTED